MFLLDMMIHVCPIEEILPTMFTSKISLSSVYHVVNLQLVFISELQFALITLQLLEMMLHVTYDCVNRPRIHVAAMIAGIKFPLLRIMRNFVVTSPILMRFVIGVFRVHLLVQS